MNFSKLNKEKLQAIADELEIVVEAKKEGKPTNDELIAGLEEFEKEEPDTMKVALEKLGFIEEKETDEAEEVKEDTKADIEEGEVFTYVGKGEGSPRRINFMSKQEFVRGKPTVVTDPELLSKLRGGVPTFVKGKPSEEALEQIDLEAEQEADGKRAENAKIQDAFSKKHNKE